MEGRFAAPDGARYYYSHRLARIILRAMSDVLGSNGLNAVLNLARTYRVVASRALDHQGQRMDFASLGALMQAVEEMYGPRGGQRLALRIGRVCFQHAQREFGPLAGLSDLARRVLPLPLKLKVGVTLFAETLNQCSDQIVHVEEMEDRFLCAFERCPLCWQRQTEEPCCHLAVGLWQEALYWLSEGHSFEVQETACHAAGDAACVIMFGKQPVDID